MQITEVSTDEKKARPSEPSIQSVERAIMILRCFEKHKKLSLAEICSMVSLHKSTVYGLTTTLKNGGLLDKDTETGKYRLGVGLYRLAALVETNLRDLCLPHIRALCEETEETTNLVVPDGTCIIYMEKQESVRSVHIGTGIGQRIPMYCTAVGKAIMAWLRFDEASSILDRSRLIPYTNFTLTSKETILEDLTRIRQRGYAVDVEELEYGIVCVAVPLLNAFGKPVGALSCSGPKHRMSEERIRFIAQRLMHHSTEVSKYLLN